MKFTFETVRYCLQFPLTHITHMEETMKLVRILGVLVVLFGLGIIPAYAAPDAPPGKWITDFTVLDLENTPATVDIMRYSQ